MQPYGLCRLTEDEIDSLCLHVRSTACLVLKPEVVIGEAQGIVVQAADVLLSSGGGRPAAHRLQ